VNTKKQHFSGMAKLFKAMHMLSRNEMVIKTVKIFFLNTSKWISVNVP